MASTSDITQDLAELPETHLAIVLHPPSRDIRLQMVPCPRIVDPDDAIIKVELAGLCGSDLHAYRGHEPVTTPFVMGHEAYGTIVALGSSFRHSPGFREVELRAGSRPEERAKADGYASLRIGQKVVSAFSTSCMECELCKEGHTSRCSTSQLRGTPSLPGAQAQYIRVPQAGGIFLPVPSSDGLDPKLSLLLADILPTGYFAAVQALEHRNVKNVLGRLNHGDNIRAVGTKDMLRIAVVGLGPVGVCALISLLDTVLESPDFPPTFIIGVDPLLHRRQRAKAWIDHLLTGVPPGTVKDEVLKVEFYEPDSVKEDSFHAILEVVGNTSALDLAYRLARPFGVISSVGVHTSHTFPIPPPALYDKNISLAFGRCPVRALYSQALGVLQRRQATFASAFVEQVVRFSGEGGEERVKSAYERFEKGDVGKVLFDAWN